MLPKNRLARDVLAFGGDELCTTLTQNHYHFEAGTLNSNGQMVVVVCVEFDKRLKGTRVGP